ncbi:hypothetical protein DFJ73DRAFT_844616 [Zopfochytrium polystomum]|nr:hypothetical protein DFJ73DRAFT_844616 [Zopfochytrium polystomum]
MNEPTPSCTPCSASNPYGQPVQRAPEDPIDLSAGELWTHRQVGTPQATIFEDPLYTPPTKEQTGIGPLLKPLHFPEYDQKRPTTKENPKMSRLYAYRPYEFGHVDDPIGDYPRLPYQWAHLRDPYKYWDQQGRRNYGEVIQDQANNADLFAYAGPAPHPGQFVRMYLQLFAAVFGVYTLIAWWDPEEHLICAKRDYPFNGLRVELGGDALNEADDSMASRRYKAPGDA